MTAPARTTPYKVWHLIGPQGSGKSIWAEQQSRTIADQGGFAVHMDVWEFDADYAGNPQRVADAHHGLTVLMLEDHNLTDAALPRHYMQGDIIVRFQRATERECAPC